jgi:hypothetical protein
MPNKQRTNVRKSAGADTRTRQTTTALAYALIQLIQESGRFDEITVRQILERAGVAARMLAAALIESVDWWFDHESIAAAEIDTAFHSLARTMIGNGTRPGGN